MANPSELQAEIEKLERKHAENPEGRYFVPLANAYRKLGELERAEVLLRDGLRRHPDYLSAHIVLGRCLADRGALPRGRARSSATSSPSTRRTSSPCAPSARLALGARAGPARRQRWFGELLAVGPDERGRAARPRSLQVAARPRRPSRPPSRSGRPRRGGGDALGETPAAARSSHLPAPPPRPPEAGTPDEVADGTRPAVPERVAPAEEPRLEDGSPEGVETTDSPPGRLVTETIAELYARQGLHERAAEVYRELIRRRGGDPALEAGSPR